MGRITMNNNNDYMTRIKYNKSLFNYSSQRDDIDKSCKNKYFIFTKLYGLFDKITQIAKKSWSKREKIINLRNGEIKFVGKVHGSVGWEYEVIYPQDAFSVNRDITYCHPEMMKAGMCGGDEALVEYTLKPFKPGLFKITEKIYFRGNLQGCYIHRFLVE